MSLALAPLPQPAPPPPASQGPDTDGRPALRQAIAGACARMAPLWPLADWVAVNPFLGFADQRFDAAAQTLDRLVGARVTMPRSFYRQALEAGRMTYEDIAWALDNDGADLTLASVLSGLEAEASPAGRRGPRVATVAEVLDRLAKGDRQVSRTAFMVDEISRWCAAYFDAGQARWSPPWRGRPLYAAWRAAVRVDANPTAMGLRGFQAAVAQVPEDAEDAIAFVLGELGVPEAQWADYLFRALFDIRGWAAFVRRLDWEAERGGGSGQALKDLLAIRVVWGFGLYAQRSDAAFKAAWTEAMAVASLAPLARPPADLRCDLILQRAYERAFQRRLIAELAAPPPVRREGRPAVQAVFCIDVRSEVYRRALESLSPDIATLGFAGFFGMPISYAAEPGVEAPHCPALLAPQHRVDALGTPASAIGRATAQGLGLADRLKASAVSAFGFVEAFGLAYLGKLAAKAAPAYRPAEPPPTPDLHVDLPLERRVALAEGALRGMSLVADLARLVVLVGHGSTSANNPHAAGLACGACGGHDGAPNARLAVTLLNDPEVRASLAARGLVMPADTVFLAALHDTTTDELRLLDACAAPASHAEDIDGVRRSFAAASRTTRAERATHLGVSDPETVAGRSRDWSQVRPEWGLAGAAAFIAAPRATTRGRDLRGRAFLHDYDRRTDPEGRTLELILTAPMVVASWISLQYYGSTVDNAAFGAGDKTLHNVCGGIGVFEGNAGDLRAGLPLQSVHDGERFRHEPLRLTVLVAADPQAISDVLSRNEAVRDLVDNGWLHLFALDDEGRVAHRYAGRGRWTSPE